MVGIEPILQRFRHAKVRKWILPEYRNSTLVDFGCDKEMNLLHEYTTSMKRLIGVDIIIPSGVTGNIETITADIQKPIPLNNNSADVVTMLAVLEHLKDPQFTLQEAYRILKRNGRLIITVPSPRSKWVLELLAQLRFVRQDMIDQHENYFDCKTLSSAVKKAGFSDIKAQTWEAGFNIFLTAVK